MSPRAAWRLEADGFTPVYDFVPGKVAWLAAGLPVEGQGPHYAVAGEVVDTDVPTCILEQGLAEAHDQMERAGTSYCVVLNDQGIILGRVRRRDLSPEAISIRQAMQPGPATVRPEEELKPLVERMHKAGVTNILVATARGKLIGVVDRDRAETALKNPPVGPSLY